MIQGRDLMEVRSFLRGLPGEASLRTRTGRAYYAAYLEVLDYCVRFLGHQRRRSPSEHGVISRLIATRDPGVAVNLENLRRIRNIADYDIEASLPAVADDAMWSGILASSIINRLDELISEATTGEPSVDPTGPEDE